MSSHNFEMTFVADTAAAVDHIKRLEAEVAKLQAAANGSAQKLGDATTQLNNMAGGAGAAAGQVQVVTSHLGHMNSGLLNLSNGLQVFTMLSGVLTEISDKFNNVRDHIKKFGEEFMKVRDSFNEVASLKGKDGPDDEVVAGIMKLGLNSGLMPAEANAYVKQFEGSIPAGKQKGHIDDKTAEEVAKFGARFGLQKEISPGTAGNFAGIMSQYQKVPDVETAARVMGQVAYGLNEGVGEVEPLMRTLLNTAGSVVALGGPMESLPELAVMEGVASTHANPYATGTRLRQAVRALRETKGPAGEWLKAQGVRDGMGHLDRLKAIRPALAAEVKKGKGLDQAIKEFVTGDDTEARSLAEQIGDIDLMDIRLAKMGAITGKGVIASNDRYYKAQGRHKLSEARKKGQEMLLGHENEQMQLAMENARQKMVHDRERGPGDTVSETISDYFGWTGLGTGAYGNMKASERKFFDRATDNLIAEARRLGMPEAEIFDRHLNMAGNEGSVRGVGNRGGRVPTSSTDRALNSQQFDRMRRALPEAKLKEAYRDLSTAVERRGGDTQGPTADVAAGYDKMAAEQRETNRLLGQLVDKPNQPGPPIAHPGAMRRAAAVAPKRP